MSSKTHIALTLAFATAVGVAAKGIPEPTGEYYVSYTQHVFDHVTVNDPLAGTGQSLVVTFYYPTLQAPDNTTPYLNPETASIFETAYNATPGLWGDLTAPMTFQAPPVNTSTYKPTLFFSPGGGFGSELYPILLTDLVSHGYVVAAVDHPYEAPYLQFPYGGPGVHGLPVWYTFTGEFVDLLYGFRVPDLVAAMSLYPGLVREYNSPFNVTHFGVLGHSIGGAASAEALQAALSDEEGGSVALIGGVNLDGSMVGKPAEGGPGADVKKPFLQFGNEMHSSATDPSWANFSEAQTGYFREITVVGSRHLDFSDITFWKELGGDGTAYLGGSIDGLRMTALVRRYVKAFFDRASGLPPGEGDEGLLNGENDEFPEAKIQIRKD